MSGDDEAGGAGPASRGGRGRGRRMGLWAVALASAAVGLLAWRSAGPLRLELGHALLLLASPARVEDPAVLLAHPPAVGTFLDVRAQVRCVLPPLTTSDAPPWPLPCDPVRWGGTELAPAVAPDAALDQLSRWEGFTAGFAEGTAEPARILRAWHLVAAVDAACHGAAAAPCARLQETMTTRVTFPGAGPRPRWSALVLRAARRPSPEAGPWETLQAELPDDDVARSDADTVTAVRALLHEVLQARQVERFAARAREAAAGQRGGVLLRRWSEEPQELPRPCNDCGVPIDFLPPPPSEHWARYAALATPRLQEWRGVVAEVSRDERGDLVLGIDASRGPENASRALVRLAAMALAITLALAAGRRAMRGPGSARW